MCADWRVELHFVYGLAAFGLSKNSPVSPPDTDLPWLHPDTVARPDYLARAERVFEGKPVCAIGDWGERQKNPQKYLADWAHERSVWGLATPAGGANAPPGGQRAPGEP